MKPIYVFALSLITTSQFVQAEEVTFSPDATESCLATAVTDQDAQACVGASASSCMDASANGAKTDGMTACAQAEYTYWEARMSLSFDLLIEASRAGDEAMASTGFAGASMAETLSKAQAAWASYRDATCAYETATATDGTMSGPIAAGCRLAMTARQALYLETANQTN